PSRTKAFIPNTKDIWDFCLGGLKWDHKTLIDDLAKMSKDRDYKPVFNPKSKEVLEKMNAEKRASLVDES
ncbi:hypothetical protein, partial [Helicobacter pylori]|uniref:hypothetical protein n=1 Tax=Helicobacter pylori TaxID=210 RepID=UPI003CC5852F